MNDTATSADIAAYILAQIKRDAARNADNRAAYEASAEGKDHD